MINIRQDERRRRLAASFTVTLTDTVTFVGGMDGGVSSSLLLFRFFLHQAFVTGVEGSKIASLRQLSVDLRRVQRRDGTGRDARKWYEREKIRTGQNMDGMYGTDC